MLCEEVLTPWAWKISLHCGTQPVAWALVSPPLAGSAG